MKLFKNLKKGFTLIELVVVIAVIAILSAVSVVSYVAITNKAQNSNDENVLRQINMAIAARKTETEPATMSDALVALKEEGGISDVEKLLTATYKKNTFAYDQVNKEFVLLKEGEEPKGERINYFKMVSSQEELTAANSEGYSCYLKLSYSGSAETSKPLDVGENDDVTSVVYSFDDTQNAIIRTNGGSLKIGSASKIAKGQIFHYGLADKIESYTESNCLHVYGAVGRMEVKAGKTIAEKGGVIYLTEAKAGVAVEQKGGKFIIPSGVSTSEVAPSVVSSIGYTAETVVDEAYDNSKRVDSAYEIANLAELERFRDLVNGGFTFEGCVVKLTSNITLNDGWTPIAEGSRDVAATKLQGSYVGEGATSFLFKGTFDGQNHYISNLNNKNYMPKYDYLDQDENAYTYGFFGILNTGAKIKNIKFSNVNISKDFGKVTKSGKATEAESIGSLVGYVSGNVEISNITIESGSLSSSKTNPAVGGVIGRWYNATESIELVNLVNKASVNSLRSAGIVGFVSKTSVTYTLRNCSNSGTITTTLHSSVCNDLIQMGQGTLAE